MTYKITVQADPGFGPHKRGLAAAARAVLSRQRAPSGALTIQLMGIERMRLLNLAYAGLDQPTDILSFPSGELLEGEPYLGDLALCVPYAQDQARRHRREVSDELNLLVVHGVLHLLGFDHDLPDRKRAMWDAQEEILQHLADTRPSGRSRS
jgi:probable rRNA maturation factor